MKPDYIRQELVRSTGAGESSSVTLKVSTETGEAELVIERTIREYYPVTDYDKVMDLHDRLNRGGGRRAYTLEDLTR